MTKKQTAVEKPTVLAFERKLDPSDALFFSGNWNNIQAETGWKPIKIREKTVRGTISNRLKTPKQEQDPAKLNHKIESPNPQTVDVCALPPDSDTLKTVFSLRILEGTGRPSACNSPTFQAKLAEVISTYTQEHGFEELARRYAFNLANGRFLWRNRIGAEDIKIRVEHLEQGMTKDSWTFSALDIPLRSFTAPDSVQKDVESLGKLIAQGLRGEKHVLLQITAVVRIGKGLEVYPSQEFINNKGESKTNKNDEEKENKKSEKKKILYAVNETAGFHSQKIGNAIRTIDNWYPDGETLGPIAVEVYGAVTSQGTAYRQSGDKNFYSLFDNWILKNNTPPNEQQHYVMAVLIRGGVFGAV